MRDVLDAAVGNSPARDIGNMQHLLLVAGMGYAFGGLLFGIALFQASILTRWASLLLVYATVSVLVHASRARSRSASSSSGSADRLIP